MSSNINVSNTAHHFSIKQHWTLLELTEYWTLSKEEMSIINRKKEVNKLVYAIKLKYFDIYGCFLHGNQDVPLAVINMVASQLSVSPKTTQKYSWDARSERAHNDEIRTYYGFHRPKKDDWEQVQAFIENSLWAQALPMVRIYNEVYRFLKNQKTDPPAYQIFERKINNMCSQIEYKFFEACIKPANTNELKTLLEEDENGQTPLIFIRKPTGRISHKTIEEEIKKLDYLTSMPLTYDFFEKAPRKILKKYYDLVAMSSPYDLKAMGKIKSNALLACFCYYKNAKILDNLTEIFTRRFKKMENIAKIQAKEDLFKWHIKKDQEQLFNKLVNISLEYPDGIIKEKIYEGVGGKEKLEESQLSCKSSRQKYKEFEYKHMGTLYVHHHRNDIIALLGKIKLASHSNKPLCNAIDAILKKNPLVLKGVLTKNVRKTVESNSTYCELAVLGVLRNELKCKNMWVQHTLKHSDPDQDLPQDFKQKKHDYCQMLNLPEDVQEVVRTLKVEMLKNITAFNTDILTNPDVRIEEKNGKPHIFVTPYGAQTEPVNLQGMKQDIKMSWPNLTVLDMVKETDFRLGLAQELIEMSDNKVVLDLSVLQPKVLVCLFAMGTNIEFSKICAGMPNISEADLKYIKNRFVTVEGLRHIIKKLVDGTLAIRDKEIWGDEIAVFSSDAIKYAVWAENLMSEFHIRYRGYGVMAYWHVDKKALCISGQLIKCSDSEIPAMLSGILYHGTEAKVKKHSTDTHGQSLIAFAFTFLFGIELRPRIKGVGDLKIYKPDHHMQKSAYNNIESVMGSVVGWKLVIENYDHMLQYAVAFKLRTAEPEVLLKRFIKENNKNPLYKAMLELGKAAQTNFLCPYFISKEMRIEIEETLNVGENWNSGNDFVFLGKKGVIASNDPIEQEKSILSLHFAQSCLVYVNTLMIQKILKRKKWIGKLTIEDKRGITPLFHLHMSQYGMFPLNMEEHLNIDEEEDE